MVNMSMEGKRKTSERMKRDNPMKKEEVRKKSSKSHQGQTAWNKGMRDKELLLHYKNGRKGGRQKGYNHSAESKLRMSQHMLGKKHKIVFSTERKKRLSDTMKMNRQNLEFNQKMFKSLQRSITRPHKKVLNWIIEYTSLKTISNYCIKIGRTFGSIDEADPQNKIAFYIDGNYWHNYPDGRKWDKCCDTFLKNRGWKVLRLWERKINNNPAKCIKGIINLGGGNYSQ